MGTDLGLMIFSIIYIESTRCIERKESWACKCEGFYDNFRLDVNTHYFDPRAKLCQLKEDLYLMQHTWPVREPVIWGRRRQF